MEQLSNWCRHHKKVFISLSIYINSYSGLDKGDNLSAGDIKSVNQSVEEDRKFWVQACIARIMKSLKEATYSTLIQRIHSEAANRFQESYLSLCFTFKTILT